MKPLVSLSRTAPMRRFGKFVEHHARRLLESGLDLVWPTPENGSLAGLQDVHKLLFVRPNFRIGNTVLAAGLIGAVQARFPQARVDYLGADTTAALLEGLPIHHLYCVSRGFILAPWRFVALFVRLRREKFDLAVVGGMGSYSGALYAFLSGARQRLGFNGRANRFLTVRLERLLLENAYDFPAAFAQVLGVPAPNAPSYQVSPQEAAAAVTMLQALGMGRGGELEPFLAAFVGGHLDKRWPASSWEELLQLVQADGARVVVLIGPEESALGERLRERQPGLRIVPPQSLRLFAALLARARLVVTPDSGPMHLAAALAVPTVALLQQERSRFYAPLRAEDRVLFRPAPAAVLSALRSHPRWQDTQNV